MQSLSSTRVRTAGKTTKRKGCEEGPLIGSFMRLLRQEETQNSCNVRANLFLYCSSNRAEGIGVGLEWPWTDLHAFLLPKMEFLNYFCRKK